MNYSKYHRGFAWSLNHWHNINKQDVLENPENYLGPNYKELLNFWFYWESFIIEQRNMDLKVWIKAYYLSKNLASEVIDPRFVDCLSEYLCDVTFEIIAAHLYLEREIPFTFLPLIIDVYSIENHKM